MAGAFDFQETETVDQTIDQKADLPVWPAASNGMTLDIAVNPDSSIWIIHDRHFPDYLEWVEFDTKSRQITFVTAGGKIQNLGITIHPPMDAYVARATEVCVVLMRDKQIRDMGLLPLTVRHGL